MRNQNTNLWKSGEFNRQLYNHLTDTARAGKWSLTNMNDGSVKCVMTESVFSSEYIRLIATHTLTRFVDGSCSYRMSVETYSPPSLKVEYTGHNFEPVLLHNLFNILDSRTTNRIDNAVLVEYYNCVLAGNNN